MDSIRIEKPCHEKWRNMLPNDEGRLCLSCQTTVVDFTQKTNEEIIAFFNRKGNAHFCGKYRSDQVIIPGKPVRFKWLATALAFLFGLSFLASCRKHVSGYRAQPAPVNRMEIHHSKTNKRATW